MNNMTRGITAKRLVRWISIILLIALIGGYGIWRSRDLLFGIRLSVTGITDGMTATSEVLNLSGTAKHANSLSLDGRTVPLTESGTWQDTILLLPGSNVITIAATDKFQRTIFKEYNVVYIAPAPQTQN